MLYGGTKSVDYNCDENWNCVPKDWFNEVMNEVDATGEKKHFQDVTWGDDTPTTSSTYIQFDSHDNLDVVRQGRDLPSTLKLDRINLKAKEYNSLETRNVSHQYAFKMMVPDKESDTPYDAAGRTPVIIAGGRGSDVSNLWDQKVKEELPEGVEEIDDVADKGKVVVTSRVLDISDFEDPHNYIFYSMDYPGYTGSNPQNMLELPGGENNILTDYKALFDYVYTKDSDAHNKKPLLAGVSMGAGVVQGLAEKIVDNEGELNDHISGMLLINPFETMDNTMLDMYGGAPTPWAPFLGVLDDWNSALRMKKLADKDVAICVYSSYDDDFIKSEQHRELFKIAGSLADTPAASEDHSVFGAKVNEQGEQVRDTTKLLIQASGGHKDVDLFGEDLDSPAVGGETPTDWHKHTQRERLKNWFEHVNGQSLNDHSTNRR